MSSLNLPGLRPVSCECLLIRGTASDVLGILSETWFRNMVRLRRTVTSENGHTVGLGIRKTVIYMFSISLLLGGYGKQAYNSKYLIIQILNEC